MNFQDEYCVNGHIVSLEKMVVAMIPTFSFETQFDDKRFIFTIETYQIRFIIIFYNTYGVYILYRIRNTVAIALREAFLP